MTTDAKTSVLPAQDVTSAVEIALSVVICTYNRAPVLEGTLESYAGLLEARDPRIELIVVDNNSTDATAGVVESARATIPGLRYVHEPQQGLSHARNRGICESRGAIVAFADDDVFFESNWALALVDAFARQPAAHAVGGKSTPLFDGGRPDWMRDDFLIFYGDTRFGGEERWMDFPDHPFGLNMAFRREVFEQIGYFNPRLGRIKASLLSGEESDIFERLHLKGLRTWYVPQVHLFHRIPAERTTLKWIEKRYYWQGVSDAVSDHSSSSESRLGIFAESLKLFFKAISAACGSNLSPRKVFWHARSLATRTHVQYLIGKAIESLKIACRLSGRT